MKITSADFVVSSPDLATCPDSSQPEFAFIGRSNVGKSSLINLLTERRDLAKVSDKPGKTQLINFFLINRAWHLVDLPGYGYAVVSKEKRAEFAAVVSDYLAHRDRIRCVFVLIDSRLPPQQIDLEFITWIGDCGVPFVLVFTKTDKQSPTATKRNIAVFTQGVAALGRPMPRFFLSSAKEREGRLELLQFIDETLTGEPAAAPT